MIMWDKVIMKKEDAVFDGLIDDSIFSTMMTRAFCRVVI